MSRIVSPAGVLSHEPPTDSATTPETGDNKYLAWTSHDLAFLETHYGVMKTTELAEKLWCTIVSVRVTGGRLEREKNGDDRAEVPEKHRQEWASQELRFLEKHYGVMKTAEIAGTHGRSVMSVRLVARSPGRNKASLAWTEAEEDIISMEYASDFRIKNHGTTLWTNTRRHSATCEENGDC